MGPSDPLGPGTWDQKGLGLFYALKTELHGDPRIGRKRTSTSSKLRECGTCSLLDLISIGR